MGASTSHNPVALHGFLQGERETFDINLNNIPWEEESHRATNLPYWFASDAPTSVDREKLGT
jgi:hypothetical protein